MAAREFHYQWEWRLNATPAALWPLVSDTNRFNRDAGVPHVKEEAGSSTGARKLTLRRYGVLVEWEEEPFEWVRPSLFSVARKYAGGPVAEMRVRTELIPDGPDATLVRYQVDATPRNALGYAAIPFEVGFISARRFEAVFRRYAATARQAPTTMLDYAKHHVDFLPQPARLAPGGAERLARIRSELRAGPRSQHVDALIDVITRADDFSVARMRPYVLADMWRVTRREVVDLCLHATRAGLLDLQWDVLCPMCRGAKQTNNKLAGISQPVHCASCNIDFFANFEQSVELTFVPNPAIRRVEVFPFCVGGPQLTPHIVVQQWLQPGETRTVKSDLERGRYRARASGLAGGQLLRVADSGDSNVAIGARDAGWPNHEPVAASDAGFTLSNETSAPQLMLLERLTWSDQALTAAEVIALQEFRDLFASEALRPGEAINVGSMAILFTDLRGSTRMYREIGDAPAFGRVMNHFDVLRQAMQEEEGAIVKTIGDAIMAVFRRPAAAIRSILRAQELLAHLPEGVQPPNLKAGIHFGPCIAVTQNERLDYFGSTVNIAARLDGLSQGGEIIISQAVADDPEVQQLLQQERVTAVKFRAQLKGFDDEDIALLRIAPNTVASTS